MTMTTDIATIGVPTALAVRANQDRFDKMQLAALRQLGVEEATDGDLDLFFHTARRTGLDPFAKQIYMVGRKVCITDWKDGRPSDRWVTKYTIQVGIDGYRVLGHRLAAERGDDIEVSDPLWCGPNGVWTDVWLDPDTPPVAAKTTITKNSKTYTAVAMYSEYVQTTKVNGVQVPTSMWKKMPANQTLKCSEAAAWRKAYPLDFSGLVLEDAAQTTVIDAEPVDEDPVKKPAPTNGLAGLRDKLGVGDQQQGQAGDDGEDQGDGGQGEPMATSAQLTKLNILLEEEGFTKPADKRAELARHFDRKFTSSKQLTKVEASQLIEHFLTPADARPIKLGSEPIDAELVGDGEQDGAGS